ncbi:MAG: 6-carboxytetrahydropterin synthase QueD [Gammaproteobacteria bacterium]
MMKAVYTLTVTVEFSASHIIPGHPGKCKRLHGHNWKAEIHVQAHTLNSIGIAVDFQDIKRAAAEPIAALDHYHLNDLPQFEGISPTAENVSAWLYREIARSINRDGVTLSAVKLWETDRSCVEYREGV